VGEACRQRYSAISYTTLRQRRPRRQTVGGTVGAPQQVENLGGLAAMAGASCLFGRLRPCVGLLRRVGLLPDLALDGATWALCAAEPRLLGGLWLLGRGPRPRCWRFRLERRLVLSPLAVITAAT
jgi:hypothetical protein